MCNSHLSMKIFGLYLCCLGLTLAFVPNLVLPIFGFEEVTDVWIRLLGLSFFLISTIYYTAIKEQWLSFYRLSAFARVIVCVFIIGCVVMDIAPWPLVIFAVIDLLGAAWTSNSLPCQSNGPHPELG